MQQQARRSLVSSAVATVAVGAALLGGALLASCTGASREELLANKPCGPAGECASGYVCDPGPHVCVPEGTPIGTGGQGGTGAGGTGAGGTGAGGGGTGGEGGCHGVGDCPPPASSCELPFCLAGQCGTTAVQAGTLVPANEQVPGDCQVLVCNGVGGIVTQNDDADVPDDGHQCTNDFCVSGLPQYLPLALGTHCTDNDRSLCDGAGTCIDCLLPSDCAGLPPDDECQARTCDAGACGQDFAPNGTPILAQQPGDCQLAVCDGNGGPATIPDDGDTPVDGNDCTNDLCTNGTPSHSNVPVGTACGPNHALQCNAAGQCAGCTSAAQCGADTSCMTWSCANQLCSQSLTLAGTPLPVAEQTPGDCLQSQCNGSGGVQYVPDDADLPPADSFQCTDDLCVSGSPQHPFSPLDTPCAETGGSVCDGNGVCVECNSPGQCANQGTVCQSATCVGHACGLANTDSGTPAPAGAQTAGDCTVVLCDGSGGTTTAADPNDPLVDGNPCTLDACDGTTPTNDPLPAGTPCGSGLECNAAGACIGLHKPDGDPCGGNGECQSTHCVDGVCCGALCDAACSACSAAKTGGTDGVCAPIPSGQDPDVECGSTNTCNGAGACALECGATPTPPAASCPAECTGGCAAGICYIDCNLAGSCQGVTVTCPAGLACEVQCGASLSCAGATIVCADKYACHVVCNGDCANAHVQCGTGSCALVCGSGQKCSGTALSCGVNHCQATCGTGAQPTVTCGSSCACTTCALLDDGQPCSAPNQCSSSYCPVADGVCCNASCTTKCLACLGSKTGGSDGVCGFIPAGQDPDAECQGAKVCDGAGHCTN
jgi:hypothetical protein